MSTNITVFISGGGSNLEAVLKAIECGEIDGRVVAVIADRECSGSKHARSRHIPFYCLQRKLPATAFADALLRTIPVQTQLIVLAGFLSIIPPAVITAWSGKIINLHPSLLPKYGGAGMYGLHVHRAVLAAGEKTSGCTVHYVDNGIDTGEIIAQAVVDVEVGDDASMLQRRVQLAEHRLLCETLAKLCHNHE